MMGDVDKAHDGENRFQDTALWGTKINKFKAIETSGVFKKISHLFSFGAI